MNSIKNSMLIVLLTINTNLIAQISDTISYYYPYFPDSSNSCSFIGNCFDPYRCEPIATWFTPDSVMDTSFNVYSIKTIQLSFVFDDPEVLISMHVGDGFPTDSNKVYEALFSVDSSEVNFQFHINGIEVFKTVDVSGVQPLQRIQRQIPFWVVVHKKVFSLYNSLYPGYPPRISGHSFTKNSMYIGDDWREGCDWITKSKVEYEYIVDIGRNHFCNPIIFNLFQNYPNPFNPTTRITYFLPTSGFASISIYNSFGQNIRSLVNKHHNVGAHEIFWDGKNNMGQEVSSGVYFYRLAFGKYALTKKMLLIR